MAKKRTYNSSRRKEGALETRRQIVEAARELFLSRGYTGATIEAIADRARVAPETIYATFGNKRAILSRLVEVSLVGIDPPIPLLERPRPRAIDQETDQSRQIELFAEDMYEIMGRMAPLFELIRSAARTEPEIAELLKRMLEARIQGMSVFVRTLIKNGPLRPGLTAEAAAETVWAVSSGEVFTLLTVNRGWDEGQYKKWLTDALIRLLLP